jgi:hypothetical protein
MSRQLSEWVHSAPPARCCPFGLSPLQREGSGPALASAPSLPTSTSTSAFSGRIPGARRQVAADPPTRWAGATDQRADDRRQATEDREPHRARWDTRRGARVGGSGKPGPKRERDGARCHPVAELPADAGTALQERSAPSFLDIMFNSQMSSRNQLWRLLIALEKPPNSLAVRFRNFARLPGPVSPATELIESRRVISWCALSAGQLVDGMSFAGSSRRLRVSPVSEPARRVDRQRIGWASRRGSETQERHAVR